MASTKSFHFCSQSQTNTKSSIIQSPTTSWLLQKSFYIAAGDPPVHRGWLLAEPRLAYFSALVSTCDARPKRAQHIYLVFHHILACSRLWSDPAFYMHPPQCSCVLHHHTFPLPPSTFTCASPSNPIKPAHEGSPPMQHAVEAFCPTTYLISCSHPLLAPLSAPHPQCL